MNLKNPFSIKCLLISAMVLVAFSSLSAADSLNCTGNYSNGEKNGIWLCKSKGMIVRKERYKAGRLITYMVYNEKGQIIETMNRRGKVKKFNPCGC